MRPTKRSWFDFGWKVRKNTQNPEKLSWKVRKSTWNPEKYWNEIRKNTQHPEKYWWDLKKEKRSSLIFGWKIRKNAQNLEKYSGKSGKILQKIWKNTSQKTGSRTQNHFFWLWLWLAKIRKDWECDDFNNVTLVYEDDSQVKFTRSSLHHPFTS